MNKVSSKRAKQLRQYAKIRLEFLHDKICEFEGCRCLSSEVHHKKGRFGERLIDANYFMGVCRKHHEFIEMNPVFAKEKGYSLTR